MLCSYKTNNIEEDYYCACNLFVGKSKGGFSIHVLVVITSCVLAMASVFTVRIMRKWFTGDEREELLVKELCTLI